MTLRRTRTALLAGTALAAGLLALPSHAAEAHTQTDACVASAPETDPLEAGPVQICFTVFKPGVATTQDVPVVLHSHGWGGSRTTSLGSFQALLDAGIAVVSIDQRGFGASGGKAHVEDPAFEGEDVLRVVDHVAALDWVQLDAPGDPRLGAIGGSYGGGYQFAAAFRELQTKGTTRFDALAPEITWFSLNESLAPQDVVRTAWVAALYAAGANAHTSTVHAGLAEGVATGQWPATMDEFFADNGPAFHVAQGRQLDIPVLFGQGASDNLFPMEQGLKNFDRALTPEARARSIFVGYNGGHVLPNVAPRSFATGGDACSRTLAPGLTNFASAARQFMAEELLDAPEVLTGRGSYHLTDAAADTCLHVDSVVGDTAVEIADVVAPSVAGPAQQIELAAGPLTVAGTPVLEADVTSLGLDGRSFFGLAVGTSATDAQVVQNNVRPHREQSVQLGTRRRIELPSIAVEVPAGQKLFLTVSPVSDMFAAHGSRTPSVMVLRDAEVQLPVVD